LTKLTIVDARDSRQPGSGADTRGQTVIKPTNLESAVLRAVKEDPFASISEIRHDVAEIDPEFETGWWRIVGILRRRRLLTRRSRFRHARGR